MPIAQFSYHVKKAKTCKKRYMCKMNSWFIAIAENFMAN